MLFPGTLPQGLDQAQKDVGIRPRVQRTRATKEPTKGTLLANSTFAKNYLFQGTETDCELGSHSEIVWAGKNWGENSHTKSLLQLRQQNDFSSQLPPLK